MDPSTMHQLDSVVSSVAEYMTKFVRKNGIISPKESSEFQAEQEKTIRAILSEDMEKLRSLFEESLLRVKEDHQNELSKQQQVIHSLKETIEKQRREFTVWESAKAEWEEQIMSCEKEKIPLQKKIEELQQTIKRLENRVKRRDATIAEKSEQFHHELAQLKSYIYDKDRGKPKSQCVYHSDLIDPRTSDRVEKMYSPFKDPEDIRLELEEEFSKRMTALKEKYLTDKRRIMRERDLLTAQKDRQIAELLEKLQRK
eukprot:TRINITY_DN2904_c0_g1_i1.p1 TRINITY_DN2904_c0_g1~~TRINITY_DN2904_c0_g1_i1.p1  ORF type:complete len:275 (+),score=90.05 TRINITY_DN2904_c0_g1_i1:60-827(+)